MKAITVIPNKPGSSKIVEFEKPKVSANKVLVRLLHVGLDGTDKEILEGLYGLAPKGEKRLIIGHESLGIVEKAGSKIRSIKARDFVVATVRRPDNCINCKAGQTDMCLEGNYTERGIKGRHGYFSEFYVEDEKYLVKIPKKLTNIAVLLEPLTVAEKTVRMAEEVQKRMKWKPKTALITGTGTLGLLAAMILRTKDFDVFLVDRKDDPYKKKIIKKIGAKHFNGKKVNLHDIPKKIGRQIDIIIEATGSSEVALHSMMVAGTNSVVVLASITGGDKQLIVCADCLNNGLVLGNKCVVGSVNANMLDFKNGVKRMRKIQDRWPKTLEMLITARYPFEDYKAAIENINSNIKVVIDF